MVQTAPASWHLVSAVCLHAVFTPLIPSSSAQMTTFVFSDYFEHSIFQVKVTLCRNWCFVRSGAPHRVSVQQVITNLSSDRRNEDDNYKQNLLRHNNVLYWTLLCWSGRVCVCDAVIRPSSTEFIMSPHHKFFFLFSSSCLPGARLAGGDAGRPDGTNTRKLCGVFIVQETTRSGHDGTEVDQNWTVED